MVSAVYQLSRSPKKPLALWLCRESAPFPPERHTTSPRGASPQDHPTLAPCSPPDEDTPAQFQPVKPKRPILNTRAKNFP